MPILVGLGAALLAIIIVGSLLVSLGNLGQLEMAFILLVGLVVGILAGVWDARRRNHKNTQ